MMGWGAWRRLAMLAAMVVVAVGCAGIDPAAEPDPAAFAGLVHTPAPAANLTRTAAAQPTRRDLYRLDLLLPEGGRLTLGDNPMQLRVLDRRGDTVGGAAVNLQLWLPAQALDGPTCRVRETEAGLYQVSGLNLSTPGDWMLTVTINRSGREDWAIYEVPVTAPAPVKSLAPIPAPAPPRPPAGAVVKTPAQAKPVDSPPAKLNLARSRASDKGLYKVTYLSRPALPKPNQALAWRIRLLTAAGRQVDGAKLRLSAARPPGPTQPAPGRLSVQAQGRGNYLVEGLRLPSKGWWRITVEIAGRPGADRVDFNLVLE